MQKQEERIRDGNIEDRKIFSMRDIKRYTVWLITALGLIYGTRYIDNVGATSPNSAIESLNSVKENRYEIGLLREFKAKAEDHLKDRTLQNDEERFVTRREFDSMVKILDEIKQQNREILKELTSKK